MRTKYTLLILLLFVFFFSGCRKAPVVDPNEGELITTVRIKLTDKISGLEKVFEFRDLDGEGGVAPQRFDSIKITKGLIYDCTLQLLNESVTPVADITAEVLSEADDHQFYLTPSPSLVVISNLDKDSKGLPVGLSSTWRASATTGTGIMNITLKHKPGTKAANDTIDKGETDISLDFVLKVL